jgi:hypothetical protein
LAATLVVAAEVFVVAADVLVVAADFVVAEAPDFVAVVVAVPLVAVFLSHPMTEAKERQVTRISVWRISSS